MEEQLSHRDYSQWRSSCHTETTHSGGAVVTETTHSGGAVVTETTHSGGAVVTDGSRVAVTLLAIKDLAEVLEQLRTSTVGDVLAVVDHAVQVLQVETLAVIVRMLIHCVGQQQVSATECST